MHGSGANILELHEPSIRAGEIGEPAGSSLDSPTRFSEEGRTGGQDDIGRDGAESVGQSGERHVQEARLAMFPFVGRSCAERA